MAKATRTRTPRVRTRCGGTDRPRSGTPGARWRSSRGRRELRWPARVRGHAAQCGPKGEDRRARTATSKGLLREPPRAAMARAPWNRPRHSRKAQPGTHRPRASCSTASPAAPDAAFAMGSHPDVVEAVATEHLGDPDDLAGVRGEMDRNIDQILQDDLALSWLGGRVAQAIDRHRVEGLL